MPVKATSKSKESNIFKLPRYLMLSKGAMWLDVDGENSSGVRLYSDGQKMVGRGNMKLNEEGKPSSIQPDIVKDKFGNNSFNEYGFVDMPKSEISWYVDTTTIPQEKQSRIILAYKHKILVEADPNNPPEKIDTRKQSKEFSANKAGDLVFVGKNKEMYRRLQNLSFDDLRKFINACPITEASKNNLIDLYHYEVKGYNRLYRARLEVIDLIRNKLKEFGPGLSAIRVGEDDDLPVRK